MKICEERTKNSSFFCFYRVAFFPSVSSSHSSRAHCFLYFQCIYEISLVHIRLYGLSVVAFGVCTTYSGNVWRVPTMIANPVYMGAQDTQCGTQLFLDSGSLGRFLRFLPLLLCSPMRRSSRQPPPTSRAPFPCTDSGLRRWRRRFPHHQQQRRPHSPPRRSALKPPSCSHT